jgi:RHS Repeat
MNRLATKIPDASFSAPSVAYSYFPSGKRASMTDAHGVTNYSYDVRDRMTQKAGPEGTLIYSYDNASNLLSLSATSSTTNNAVATN